MALARVDRMMARIHARTGAVLVLSLHRVSPVPNPYWEPLTPEAFETLADFLSCSCRCTTFAELPVRGISDRPVVVLSFDDGCRDFIEYAMPILHRYRLRANHNVIGHSLDSGRPPWTIMLADALNAAPRGRIQRMNVAGFRSRLTRDDAVSKARFGTALTNFLKAMHPLRRRDVWSPIQLLLDETPPDRWTRMMSANEVMEIAGEHEIGAHSYSHESMVHLDDEEFSADLHKCGSLFNTMDHEMKVYAFPNASYRPEQIAMLQQRGVEHVLLGPRPKSEQPGVHNRFLIYGDRAAELRLRAMAAPFPTRI